MPGMTATVKIAVDQKSDALKVASAALRFRPSGVEPDGSPPRDGSEGDHDHGLVWVVSGNGKPLAVRVKLGISDGSFFEVLSGGLQAGRRSSWAAREPPPSAKGGLRLRF